MLAIDTNILVRLSANDDKEQVARAEAILKADRVWISCTVLLETVWVLRSQFGMGNQIVVERLQAAAGLPNVELQDEAAVCKALDWAAAGMDLADALHVAQANGATPL